MKGHGFFKQLAHTFASLFGCAHVGQAYALKTRSFTHAEHIVSLSAQGKEHKKQWFLRKRDI